MIRQGWIETKEVWLVGDLAAMPQGYASRNGEDRALIEAMLHKGLGETNFDGLEEEVFFSVGGSSLDTCVCPCCQVTAVVHNNLEIMGS